MKNKRLAASRITVRETVIFSMLGALMYCSKIIMELFPNIHLLGMFTMVFTLVYRKRALYPIYLFVILLGLLNGFATWWVPYLYVWTLLWAVTMALPKHMPKKIALIVYPVVCALHGILFGVLYAPAQALLFGLDFRGMLLWIAQGFPFDVLHGIGNFAAGFLILPLTALLKKLSKT